MSRPLPPIPYEHVDTAPSPVELCRDGCLSLTRALRFSGLTETYLKDLLRSGELPSFKAGKRRLIPRQALVNWLASRLEEHTR
jgi:excisionase family DNA binding protein